MAYTDQGINAKATNIFYSIFSQFILITWFILTNVTAKNPD